MQKALAQGEAGQLALAFRPWRGPSRPFVSSTSTWRARAPAQWRQQLYRRLRGCLEGLLFSRGLDALLKHLNLFEGNTKLLGSSSMQC